MSYVLGILGLGLLFGMFAALHLWRGDASTTSCGGDGNCGNCHSGRCEQEDSLTEV